MTQKSATKCLCWREMWDEYSNTANEDTESLWNACNENDREEKAINAKCKLNYTRNKNLTQVPNTKVGQKISLRHIHNSAKEDPHWLSLYERNSRPWGYWVSSGEANLNPLKSWLHSGRKLIPGVHRTFP
jgi:hypothetical protein